MHILDAHLHVDTGNLDPADDGFTIENGHLLSSTLWKMIDTLWPVVCHCGKRVRVTCPCRAAFPYSTSDRRRKSVKIIMIDDTLESVIILTSLQQWVSIQ